MHEDHNEVQLHASGRQDRPGESRPWLIAGVTGRALAASAARGGHPVVVLDYFADRDCAGKAMQCRAVCSRGALRFDRKALLAAAKELCPATRSPGLVYGSGFEGRVDLLEKLAAGRSLMGNRPNLIRLLKNPQQFFPLLDRLGMSHPETRFSAPSDSSGWLAKASGGAGGVQVQPAHAAPTGPGVYYQRLEAGRILSATFLADGHRSAILGFNQQWTTGVRPELPYQFGGAVGGISLARGLGDEITRGLDSLVAETGLVGLNGLDFVLADRRWSVLEVNPRPTATAELYDADYPRGLFDWHLRACQGELPRRIPRARACRALAIVSAAEPWESSEGFDFPSWCRDLPRAGLRFSPGDPVCTVHASAPTPPAAMRMVAERKARLESLLLQSAALA